MSLGIETAADDDEEGTVAWDNFRQASKLVPIFYASPLLLKTTTLYPSGIRYRDP
jgi:hypothetical protein